MSAGSIGETRRLLTSSGAHGRRQVGEILPHTVISRLFLYSINVYTTCILIHYTHLKIDVIYCNFDHLNDLFRFKLRDPAHHPS